MRNIARHIAFLPFLFFVFCLGAPNALQAQWSTYQSGGVKSDTVVRPASEWCFAVTDVDATTTTVTTPSGALVVDSYAFNRMTVTSTTAAIAAYASGNLTSTSRDLITNNTLYNVYRSGSPLGIVLRSNATATGSGTLSFTNTGSTSYTPTTNDLLLLDNVPAASINNTILHQPRQLAVKVTDAATYTLAGVITISGTNQWGRGVSDTIQCAAGTTGHYAYTTNAYSKVTNISMDLVNPATSDILTIGVIHYGITARTNALLANYQQVLTVSGTPSWTTTDFTTVTGVWNPTYGTWYKSTASTVGDTLCFRWYNELTSDPPTGDAAPILALPTTFGHN